MRASIANMRRVTVDRGTRRNVLNIEEFMLQPGELEQGQEPWVELPLILWRHILFKEF
jgi:hypothetical protein